jgi:hypothetical protein
MNGRGAVGCAEEFSILIHLIAVPQSPERRDSVLNYASTASS